MKFGFEISLNFGKDRADQRATKQILTHPRDPVLASWFGGGENTAASMEINNNTAMTISSVYAAIRAISEDIAKLPLILYRRLEQGGKERATGHPVFRLLRDAPNDEMGSFDFRETMMGWVLSWGNAFAEIERDRAGRPVALHILPTPQVTIERTADNKLFYRVDTRIGPKALDPIDIFHIRGMSSDGIRGWSPISLARESLGLTMAIERYGATFFGNNAMPGGVLEHPDHLEDGGKLLKESWEDIHKGVSGSHKVAVLEEGMKWHQIGLPAEDAQFVESGQFRIQDSARWFRLPPHKIQQVLQTKFKNLEELNIDYVTDSLQPWAVRLEQEIKLKLLTLEEQSTLFAEHLFAALLRGNMTSRSEALQIQRRNGIINADEWREIENLNPLPNDEGKIYIVEKNMATLEQIENPPEPTAPALPDNSGDDERSLVERIADAHIEPLTEAFSRILRVEQDKFTRAAKKDGFDGWCEKFYKEHALYVRGGIATPIDAAARAIYAAMYDSDMPEEVEQQVGECTDGVVSGYIEYLRKVNLRDKGAAARFRDQWYGQEAIQRLVKLIQGLNNDNDGN